MSSFIKRSCLQTVAVPSFVQTLPEQNSYEQKATKTSTYYVGIHTTSA